MRVRRLVFHGLAGGFVLFWPLLAFAHQELPTQRPPVPTLESVSTQQPFPAAEVWTVKPNVPLVDGNTAFAVQYVFTRLEVLVRDSVGLRVRCPGCPDSPEGYVSETDIVFERLPAEVTAWGELAEFALSIRRAAEDKDLNALRTVMAPDFSFSFIGIQSPDAAFAAWAAEGYATLDRVPALLDQGLGTLDERIWSAPPIFVEIPGYQGLRLGFQRREDGRWEWLYLIQSISSDRGSA